MMDQNLPNDNSAQATDLNQEFAQLKEEITNFRLEIDFAAKALDGSCIETSYRLSQLLESFESKLIDLKSLLEKQEEQNSIFVKELSVMTLLPDKLASRFKDTSPIIAEELKALLESSFLEAQQRFTSLQQELETIVTTQAERLDSLTSGVLKEAQSYSKSWSRKFILSLVITIIFASATSGLTSYLITTKYPRFIEITGARDIIVQDSNLKVFSTDMTK